MLSTLAGCVRDVLRQQRGGDVRHRVQGYVEVEIKKAQCKTLCRIGQAQLGTGHP